MRRNREPVEIATRKTFSKKDRARIFAQHDGICGISGVKIRPEDEWQVEHRLALALGGTNDDENVYPALVDPHKGKTRLDVKAISKAKRLEKKHFGPKPEPKMRSGKTTWAKGRKIPSRPFEKRKPE